MANVKRLLRTAIALSVLACGAVAADESGRRWYGTVASLTVCPGEYVLVKAELPPLDVPPGVREDYRSRPNRACVKAGEFLGQLAVGDGVFIAWTGDGYQIAQKRSK